VWAPVRMAKQKLPVFVWFHGGEHASGSASETLTKRAVVYDGTRLAEQGMIVVSVNYRLGPLGFLAHKQLAKAKGGKLANVGLWDQQQALRWVHANALSFGGDKNNVTIAGQGSGASDVCLHAVAQESQGLFAHVVQQSGGCTTYQPTAAQLQGRAQPWLDQLSCDDADLLACLQDKTVDELYSAADNSAFVPCVDGDFIADQPRHLFDQGQIADVSFLMGSNAEESSVYIDQFPDVETEEDYHSVIQELFPEIGLKELCEAYPHEQFADADHPYQKSLAYVLGDGHVVCSTLDTAIRAREAGANVYLYNFEGPSLQDEGDAARGAEIPYVFGTLSAPTDDEAALSTQMQSYWTNFALSGDPDDGTDPTWPALTASKPWRMSLSSELSVLKAYRQAECDVWSQYYDSEFGK
ncbi:MAG TPA: carboxylesterase family protein, partial [Polyangiales bacterium]|nr:carboxylesterase family protein [Polyangiales bacterium]